jgi:hypothetical protein
MPSVRSDDVAATMAPRPFYAGTYEGAPLGVGDRIVAAASRGAR